MNNTSGPLHFVPSRVCFSQISTLLSPSLYPCHDSNATSSNALLILSKIVPHFTASFTLLLTIALITTVLNILTWPVQIHSIPFHPALSPATIGFLAFWLPLWVLPRRDTLKSRRVGETEVVVFIPQLPLYHDFFRTCHIPIW